MPLKFATWSAVSTEQQAAEDKVSLAVQQEKTKEHGLRHGWQFVRAYSAPGQSRTRYASLYHAEKNIPELHALLEAASRREFDLLIIYDLNRFRSLMLQVFDVLCDYNVQLLALSNPRPPVSPQEYSEEQKTAARMLISVSDIISENEISSLRRHYRDKMPRRITDKKLHSGLGLPPYGYQKPPEGQHDRNAVLIQNPEQVSVLIQMKDWFFDGLSLNQIVARLNQQRIPSPRGRTWWVSGVSYILANPFYAGIVTFGATRSRRDRRTGRTILTRSNPVSATGKHQPVWDLSTHQRIIAELARRDQASPGYKTRPLSRLLYCWCGSVLWSQPRPGLLYWRCSSFTRGHVHLTNEKALASLTEALQAALLRLDDISLPQRQDDRPRLKKEISALRGKRKRWLDAYETEALDLSTAAERIRAIDERIAQAEKEIQTAEQSIVNTAQTRKSLEALSIAASVLPRYLREAPPAEANARLREVIKKAIINQDKTVTIEWQ